MIETICPASIKGTSPCNCLRSRRTTLQIFLPPKMCLWAYQGDAINAILTLMATRPDPLAFGLNQIKCIVETVCHPAPHTSLDVRFAEQLGRSPPRTERRVSVDVNADSDNECWPQVSSGSA